MFLRWEFQVKYVYQKYMWIEYLNQNFKNKIKKIRSKILKKKTIDLNIYTESTKQ